MPHQRATVALSLLAAGLAGCSVESTYDLRLLPQIPNNHDLLRDAPALKIVLRSDEGAEVRFVDEAATGSPSAGAMPPLDAAHVGLVIEEPGGPRGDLNATLLRGYGEAGPFDLARESGAVEVSVLVSAYGRAGELGTLDTPLRYSSAVLTESGDVWLLGGLPDGPDAGADSTDEILRLTDLDSGDWQFESLGQLEKPLADGRAVLIVSDGEELILHAGGRTDWSSAGGNQANGALYNAATGERIWAGSGITGMKFPRSGHVMVPMVNGRVAIVGGIVADGELPTNADYELFDPEEQRFFFGPANSTPVAPIGLAGTAIGEDGAMFCGGATFVTTSDGYGEIPSARCAIVALDGSTREAAALPTSVSQPAMTTLRDGRVLLTGGVFESVRRVGSQAGSGETTTLSWLYNPHFDAWTPTGGLNQARGAHAMVATPAGGAMVIGGTTTSGVLYQDYGAPVDCVEVWDVEDETWTTIEPCSGVGGGALPVVASNPRQGTFVLTGGDERDDGGADFGIVAVGPWFAPGGAP